MKSPFGKLTPYATCVQSTSGFGSGGVLFRKLKLEITRVFNACVLVLGMSRMMEAFQV